MPFQAAPAPTDPARSQSLVGLDVLACEHCGGRREVLTFLTDPALSENSAEPIRAPLAFLIATSIASASATSAELR